MDNPKQEGSNLVDCRPQVGKCPMNCSQCYYNRDEYYNDRDKPNIPSIKEVGDRIVRMNAGHDSNVSYGLVVETAKMYKHHFFNTSVPELDFPGPVVYTANREEEMPARLLHCDLQENIMFVRLRVSPSNLEHVQLAVNHYCNIEKVPVVLTMMRYYDDDAAMKVNNTICDGLTYEYKKHIINSCWMPSKNFKFFVLYKMKKIAGRMVSLCGTLDSNLCKDCKNCETYYWQTLKHMNGIV